MICTVIAYTKDRDCRILRQPLSNFPKNVSEYIKNTGCTNIREERIIAYSALFAALYGILGIDRADVLKKRGGKPYLVDNDGTPLPYFINISHSDGVAAVTLSDEGEVGVDIQGEIYPDVAERLEQRYFKNVRVKYSPLEVKYFMIDGDGVLAPLEEYDVSSGENVPYSEKWTFCEAALKCEGGGFFSIGRIEEIVRETRADIISLKIGEKKFSVTTVII